MEPLFLLDAYGIIYRSYFAFISKPLRNPRGDNVSAVFGFYRSLFQLWDRYKPTAFAAVFDSRVPTFRHEMFDAYKATRAKTPEDLHRPDSDGRGDTRAPGRSDAPRRPLRGRRPHRDDGGPLPRRRPAVLHHLQRQGPAAARRRPGTGAQAGPRPGLRPHRPGARSRTNGAFLPSAYSTTCR